MLQDSTKTLFQSASRFLSGTLLSRFSGLGRDIAMAAAFGTGESIAAFLVAFRLAHLLRRLLGEGALQTAFTPQFEKLRHDCVETASHFFKSLNLLLTGLLLLLITLIMSGIGFSLWFFDFSASNVELLKLTFWMTPSLLFICLYGLNAALLQCEKQFFLSGIAPVAFNLVWIVGVFTLWGLPAHEAMPRLAGWIIVACAAQWAVTLPKTFAILKDHSRHIFQLKGPLFTPQIKTLIKSMALALIGLSASQINNALDALFARYADLEGPAYLWYAIRIQQLPLGLFGVALAGALLPPLSRAIRNKDQAGFLHFMNYALEKTLLFTIPVTAAIFFAGYVSVELLYGRGEFGPESIVGTTYCLWAYGIGLIPMTLILILSPAFYAREDYKTPVAASVASMILNVVLNTLLIAGFGLGAVSVALATSLSAWLNMGWLAWVLKRELGSYTSSGFFGNVAKITAVSLLGMAVVFFLNPYLQGPPLVRLLLQCLLFLVVSGPVLWLAKRH